MVEGGDPEGWRGPCGHPNIRDPQIQLPEGGEVQQHPQKLRVLCRTPRLTWAAPASPHTFLLQLHSSHFSSPQASLFQAFVPLLDGNFLQFSTRNLFMASAYFLFSCQVCLLDLLPPQHFPCPHLFIESNLCLFFFFFLSFLPNFFSPTEPFKLFLTVAKPGFWPVVQPCSAPTF